MNYDTLQLEMTPWTTHNFGALAKHPKGQRGGHQPLLGIIEELGEYDDATTPAEEYDALADVVIFMSDLCNATGLSLETIADRAERAYREPAKSSRTLLSTLGRASHAFLKHEQGIRVNEDHMGALRDSLVEVYLILVYRMEKHHDPATTPYEKLRVAVRDTWQRIVKKRDWQANAATAEKA